MRNTLVLVVTAAAALLVVLPAAAKEGVEATLKTNIPLDAPAGTQLTIAWTLGFADDAGERRPFDAGGIFVRLASAAGGDAETAFASGDRGDYRASVVVPSGGIGDVAIGVMGWRHDANGTRRADSMFPITNDPLPGTPEGASPISDQPTWMFVFLAAVPMMLVALVVAGRRRTARAASAAHGASP
jgi:hypothetical protein